MLQGIAPDGGLYICDPAALHFDWRAALEKDTLSMAADILHALLPDFENMEQLVRDSYAGKFPTSDLTPLTPVADKYVLELYHGPTSAFKDVALSVLPRLIVAAAILGIWLAAVQLLLYGEFAAAGIAALVSWCGAAADSLLRRS